MLKFFKSGYFLLLGTLLVSCETKPHLGSLGANISYPSGLVSYVDSSLTTNLLLLNSSASSDYSDGSIVRYTVDGSGNLTKQNAIAIPRLALNMAITPQGSARTIVAVGFSGAEAQGVQVRFYDFTTPSSPVELENLRINILNQGSQATISNLSFFSPNGDASNYYLMGMAAPTFYSFKPQVFVIKLTEALNQSIVQVLLPGIWDDAQLQSNSWNSLPPNQKSINTDGSIAYKLGFGAPTFIASQNLLVAFPFGLHDDDFIQKPPKDITGYYSGTVDMASTASSNSPATDFRAYSVIAINYDQILAGASVNTASFFVPLAWDKNGIPYGQSQFDSSTFHFKTKYLTSRAVDYDECYTNNPPPATSNGGLLYLDNNSLLMATTDGRNEVHMLKGFDQLKTTIAGIISNDATNYLPQNDLPPSRLITPGGVQPLTPYMYSRTLNVKGVGANTLVSKFHVLTQNSTCIPFWSRYGNPAFMSRNPLVPAWLSANSVADTNTTFPQSVFDPTQPTMTSFAEKGEEFCTTITIASSSNQMIYCANFAGQNITAFTFDQTTKSFVQSNITITP